MTCGNRLFIIPAMNSLAAYALALELDRELAGSSITGLYGYTGGSTIELEGGPIRFIHVLDTARGPHCFPSTAPVITGNLRKTIFARCLGARISSVTPLGLDRIILFKLNSSGDWGESREDVIRLDLTGSAAALTLFSSPDGRLIATAGSSRSRRPASAGALPPGKPFTILSLPSSPPPSIVSSESTRGDLSAAASAGGRLFGAETAALLLGAVGGLDPVLSRAYSIRFGPDISSIWPHLNLLRRTLAAGEFEWSIYDIREAGPRGEGSIYPVALPFERRETNTVGFSGTFEYWAAEYVIPAYTDRLKSSALSGARRRLKRSMKLLANLTSDLEEAGRSKEFRHFGNILVTHRHRLKKGLKELTVRDFSGETEITVPLDPTLDPDRNIRLYFRRAKKGEKGLLLIMNRRSRIKNDMEADRKRIDSISALEDPQGVLAAVPAGKRPSRNEAGGEQASFRSFEIEGSYKVYVGRNDRENDMLTHRFSSRRDLWFHAQGVPGSHVILKVDKGSIPSRIIEKAASIAAWFSKGRKSATVPVIYSEKRYVSKPRNSRPGTAVTTRGKTIFVTPSLPASGE